MEKNIKRLFIVLGVTLFVFTVIAPMSSVFAKHLKYKKPYASVLPTDVMDTDEIEEIDGGGDCIVNGENECGDDEDDCTADEWSCSWSACSKDDYQTAKDCKITYDCEEVKTPAPTKQTCKYVAPTPPPPPPPPPPPAEVTCKEDIWKCGNWGACVDRKQTRKCSLADDCKEASTESPATSQKCELKEPEPTPLPPEPVPPPSPKEDTQTLIEEEKRKAAEEAVRKAKEEELRQLEEKKKAEDLAAEEKMKEEEEKRKVEEEAKRREEELKKAEAEALRRAQEELAQKVEAEKEKQEELKRVVATPVFKEIFEEKPVIAAPIDIITELKKNAGVDPTKIDPESIKKEAEFVVNMQEKVEKKEVREEEARKLLNQEQKKEKEKEKRVLIAKASERKFRHRLKEVRKAVQERGVSDEVLVLHGENPKEEVRAVEKDTFSYPFEKKLFGVPKDKTIDELANPTLGLSQGATVPTRGMAILATCPEVNKNYELQAIDTSGRSRIVAEQMCSENKKLVLTTSSLPPGNYALQLRPVSLRQVPPLAARFPYFASTLSASAGQASDPVLIEAKSDPGVPEPVVESIEGLSIAGLRDIQVEAGADGKITVSGASDVTTMVIGTFSSAVFTSAMLADIDTGRFEVVSPRALEAGDHEVVIYASRPEEAAQSVPVKVKFRLVQVAKAEAPSGGLVIAPDVDIRQTAPEKKFPLVPFLAFSGLAVLLIGIGIFLKKNRKQS